MIVQKFLLIASIWLLCGVLGLGYLVACRETNKLATLVHEIYIKDLIGKRKSHEFEMPECTKELAFQKEKKSGELKNHKLTTLNENTSKSGKIPILR